MFQYEFLAAARCASFSSASGTYLLGLVTVQEIQDVFVKVNWDLDCGLRNCLLRWNAIVKVLFSFASAVVLMANCCILVAKPVVTTF